MSEIQTEQSLHIDSETAGLSDQQKEVSSSAIAADKGASLNWRGALSNSLSELRQSLVRMVQTGGLADSRINARDTNAEGVRSEPGVLTEARKGLEGVKEGQQQEAIRRFVQQLGDRLGILSESVASEDEREKRKKLQEKCLKKVEKSLSNERRNRDGFPSKETRERILVYCMQARREAGVEAAGLGEDLSRVREATERHMARSGVVLSEAQRVLEPILEHYESAAETRVATSPVKSLEDLGVNVLRRAQEDAERVGHFLSQYQKLMLSASDRPELNVATEAEKVLSAVVDGVRETGRYLRGEFESDLASLGRLFKQVLDDEPRQEQAVLVEV